MPLLESNSREMKDRVRERDATEASSWIQNRLSWFMVGILTTKGSGDSKVYWHYLHIIEWFNLYYLFHILTLATKFPKRWNYIETRGDCMQWLSCPPAHHSKVLLLCPGFTSLQAKHSHTLIPALKFMKITTVIFSQCLPACYIYLFITTLLNQFKGRSHDYIEVGRGVGGKNRRKGEREEKSMPLGNCILQRYFVHWYW